MTLQEDSKIRELGRCMLVLRDDLIWTPQTSAGEPHYLVEDALNSKFYRVGISEYTFISLLDAKTSISEALGLAARALPDRAVSEHEAVAICSWLLDTGLARTSQTGSPDMPASSTDEDERAAAWAGRNPLLLRVPLLHPDRFFDALLPWFSWVCTAWFFSIWIALVLSAVYHVGNDWSRFASSFDGILAPLNWLWLPLAWLFLKLVHEFAHGLACKKYGGSVREAGVIFILCLPITYVDVTSSWRLRSKWHRIITAAAGMYAELLIAAAAALLWDLTGPGVLNSLCFNVVIMASLTTLVFNANFLMKFDGYYILSDLLEIPNLYQSARQLLAHCVRKLFLRAGPLPPSLPKSRSRLVFIGCYGVAAFFWKVIVCTCMIIAASTLFQGAGIVLAILAGILWLGVPLARSLKRLLRHSHRGGGSLNRSHFAIATAMILALILLTMVPWPGSLRAPAVVEYSPLDVVRSASPGFVFDTRVRGGQEVVKGQILVVLQNEELELELKDLELALRQADIKSRAYEHEREMAAWQAEVKNRESLQKKYQQKRDEVAKLTVRAPNSGTIIAANLETLVGVYLEPGDEIVSIGSEEHKELQVAVSQDDLNAFKATLGELIEVRLSGCRTFSSRLLRINPRATLECPHPALSATNGGPLPVKARNPDSDQTRGPHDDHELLAPRFTATMELSPPRSRLLNAGRVATVALHFGRETIGEHLCRVLGRWIQQKLRQQGGATGAG